MRKREIFVLGIILLSFFIGIYFYPKMPEKMATHWNLQGEGDRYAQKFSGLFLIPFISLGVFLLFFIILLFITIPKIDQNIEEFRKYYHRFVILLIGFLLYVYLIIILTLVPISLMEK